MSTLVMVDRHDGAGEVEAEPVVVDVDGETAVLTLDDGIELVFDTEALRAALDQRGARKAAA